MNNTPLRVPLGPQSRFANTPGFILAAAVLAFALIAPAYASGERDCQFRPDTGLEGNVYEPKEWPVRLDTAWFVQPGIVMPQFDHFYLFLAYRALSARPLDAAARARLVPFDPCWRTKADGWFYDGEDEPAKVESTDAWRRARAAAGAAELPEPYQRRPKCNPDAFRTAARLLTGYQRKFPASPALRDWIAAQDMVFATCAVPASLQAVAAPAPLPANAAPGSPDWLRLDRAYQQAAAAMYRGDTADAVRRFDAIASDPASPWRATAPYLAARAHIRAKDPQHLIKASERLAPLAAAPHDSPLRADARRLLQLVRLQLEPAKVLLELDMRLDAVDLPDTIGQDVRDYATAYHRGGGSAAAGLQFGAWLSSMRGTGASGEQAYAKWRTSGQLPWLVAALTLAKKESPMRSRLLADAQAVNSKSAAWATAQYHIARLEPRRAAALKVVDRMLALPLRRLSTQDANAFKRIGLANARGLEDVARFAGRASAMPKHSPWAAGIYIDGTTIFNTGLTLDLLAQAAASPALGKDLGNKVAMVAWTRAFILDRPDVAARLAPRIKHAIPKAAGPIDEILRTKDRTLRRARSAMLFANFPGMVAHVNHENVVPYEPWKFDSPHMKRWTALDGSRQNWWNFFEGRKWIYSETPPTPPPPAFLTRAQRAALMSERKTLAGTPDGTSYLSSLVMAHARSHPRDPRLPDALAKLVQARGGDSPASSELALFRHLHRYFPNSAAARRTPTHQ